MNVCSSTDWRLVMSHSEIVIRIEMYEFCIRG
jgi:hypothetical protein